jgi:hypothetical protein
LVRSKPHLQRLARMFDPRYERAIHVDMRYMHWLMDEVYPAPLLPKERGVRAR